MTASNSNIPTLTSRMKGSPGLEKLSKKCCWGAQEGSCKGRGALENIERIPCDLGVAIG